MSASWPALHARLRLHLSTERFRRDYAAIRERVPALGPFAEPEALLAAMHARGGRPEARDRVLRSLAAEDGEAAVALALLALWPGLDAARRRLLRRHRPDPHALAGEIIGRAAIAIRTLDPDAVRRVAATVVRNVERDVGRARARERAQSARRADVEEIDSRLSHPFRLVPDGTDTDVAERSLFRRLSVSIGRDAGLVFVVAVGGEPQVEAAARLGLSAEAAKKRYRRALARLRHEFDLAA